MSQFRRVTILSMLVLFAPGVLADADLPVRDTRFDDPLDRAVRQVGVGGVPMGLGESVDWFNGNLHVDHASSPNFPFDGGNSFGLARHYDSARVVRDEVETSPTTSGYATQGLSWVGLGWVSHFGRLVTNEGYVPLHTPRYFQSKSSFELPSGESMSLKWGALEMWWHPRVKASDHRFEFFETCPMPPWNGPSPCCTTNPPKCDGEPICEAPEDRCAGRPTEEHPSQAHWMMTVPGGTRYRLELIVPYDRDPTTGYVKNLDRAGWYPTQIYDLSGNWIKIEYYGSSNPNFPEAIKRIYSSSRPTAAGIPAGTLGDMDITTELCTSVTANQCPEAAQGMLKKVIATGFKGSRSTPQRIEDEFFYKQEALNDTINPTAGLSGKRRVALLWKVTTTGYDGASPVDGGAIEYVYGDPDATSPDPQRPALLEKIVYPPHGAVSQYTYGSATLGARQPIGASTATPRTVYAVMSRTLYPDGEIPISGLVNKAKWSWTRSYGLAPGYTQCPLTFPSGSEPLNAFEMIDPLGMKSSVQYGGHVCGLTDDELPGPSHGTVLKSVTFQKNGANWSPYRTQDISYDGVKEEVNGQIVREILQQTTTTFHDDLGQCWGASTDEFGPHMQRTVMSNRNGNRWQEQSIEVASSSLLIPPTPGYFPNRSGFISHRVRSAVPSDNSCFAALNLKPFPTAKLDVIEGNNSARTEFSYYCNPSDTSPDKPKSGQVKTAKWYRDYFPPSGNPSDASPLVVTNDYSARGDLVSSVTSGGDAEPDGSSTVSYGWALGIDRGIATTATVNNLPGNYKILDLTLDGGPTATAGNAAPWKIRSASQMETILDYDGLGRVTQTTPPAPAASTRINYAVDVSNHVTRISSLTPGSGSFSPSDPNQFYAETVLDPLGRVVESRKAMPDGSISLQVTRYDELSRTVFVSELMSESDYLAANKFSWSVDRDGGGDDYQITGIPGTASVPLGTTYFYGQKVAGGGSNPFAITPDPLDRLVRVEWGGQPVSEIQYCGMHQQVERWVDRNADGTSSSNETTKTRLYYNGLGQLVMVDVQPFGGDTSCTATDQNVAADAVYEYDPLGAMTRAEIGPCLDTMPYKKWREGSPWVSGSPLQIRQWTFDAAGQLKSRTIPEENGTRYYDTYDSAGQLMTWRDPLAVSRNYHFRNRYDQAGRLTSVSKVEGVPDSAADPDVDLLGGDGQFETGLSGWETGALDSNFSFTLGTNYWRVMTGTACSIAPPPAPPPSTGSTPNNTKWLYFGSTPSCSYGQDDGTISPNGQQAVRKYVSGVTRDMVLTLQYFRQVREGAASLDNFTVYVVKTDAPTSNLSARRRIFHLDGNQPSYSTWVRMFDLRPGDLYSESEWAEGSSTKSFYLLIVFDKGDTSTSGLGTGVAIDNVFPGRRGVEKLAEFAYDEKHCSTAPSTGLRSEACSDGYESADRSDGKLTSVFGYQSGVATDRRRLVYRGLSGSVSGEEHAIDWRGTDYLNIYAGPTWVTRQKLDTLGRPSELVAPYNPTYDAVRRYEYSFKREAPTRIRESQQNVDFLNQSMLTDFTRTGALKTLRLANGTSQLFSFDTQNRLQSIASSGPRGQNYWNSGSYQIDPSGSITGIGANRYHYDLAGRLIRSVDQSNANSSGTTISNTVDYKFDPFGNMLRSDPTNLSNPIGLDATYTYLNNRVSTASTDLVTSPVAFGYDLNGNSTRFLDVVDQLTAASWNPSNQMAAYFTSAPEGSGGGYPAETYLYDASRLRTVRHRHSVSSNETASDKYVEITLRGGGGEELSRFIYKPTLGRTVLDKDFVYGFGTLLVERDVTEQVTTAAAGTTVRSGSDWNMSTSSGAGTYIGDVTTTGGSVTYLPSTAVGGAGTFTIAESYLTPGTTNMLRLKKESADDPAYSAPVALYFTNSLTSSSPNQVRGITVSRSGNTISLRWDLQNTNGKNFVLKFKRADTGAVVTLTPVGLGSSVRELSLTSQALASPCGSFHISQYQHPNIGVLTEPTGDVDLPNPEGGSAGRLPCGGGSGGGGGSPPPVSYTWVNRWHHRDHLSSLRVVTAESGAKEEGSDFYPYGLELLPASGAIGTRSWAKFTVHFRDKQTGIDYMKMREKATRYPWFSSTDLIDDVSLVVPTTWNKYSYVRASPLTFVDPNGLLTNGYCPPDKSFEDCFGPDGGGGYGKRGFWGDDTGYYEWLRDDHWDARLAVIKKWIEQGKWWVVWIKGGTASQLLQACVSSDWYGGGGEGSGPEVCSWYLLALGTAPDTPRRIEDKISIPELGFVDRLSRNQTVYNTVETCSNFFAGWGDALTFNVGTPAIREMMGTNSVVNFKSSAYSGGQIAGTAHGVAVGVGLGAKAAGYGSRLAFHGPHHSFPLVGLQPHLQLNLWSVGVRASGSAIRVAIPIGQVCRAGVNVGLRLF